MILAIDIGNTNIVIGCCADGQVIFRERVSTNPTATVLEYAAMLKMAFDMNREDITAVDGAILSSVVPAVTLTMRDAVHKYLHLTPLVVGPGIKTGLRIHIDNPAQLGSDLVVDAVAGIHHYPLPQIIIDMGTATTVSVLDAEGGYRGGMILPGVAVSHDALASRTAQLPKVAFELPKHTIGTKFRRLPQKRPALRQRRRTGRPHRPHQRGTKHSLHGRRNRRTLLRHCAPLPQQDHLR